MAHAESDFFTVGSAAKTALHTKAKAAKDKKFFLVNIDNPPLIDKTILLKSFNKAKAFFLESTPLWG